MHLHRHGKLSLPFSKKQQQQEAGQRFLIPRELAEVMAGAFAEIIQVAALYPIDTIKVSICGVRRLQQHKGSVRVFSG